MPVIQSNLLAVKEALQSELFEDVQGLKEVVLGLRGERVKIQEMRQHCVRLGKRPRGHLLPLMVCLEARSQSKTMLTQCHF